MIVKDIDKGWKRIKKQILSSSRIVVSVGVIGGGGKQKFEKHSDVPGKGEGSEIDLVKLAMIHEYGNSKIPPRPFIAQTYERNTANIKVFIESIVGGFYRGSFSLADGANKIGVWYKGKTQEIFRSGQFEANAESTKQKKGSNRPLVDTGRLRQSIDFEVKHE